MNPLDAAVLQQLVHADALQKLEALEVFETIDSTNTYLMNRRGPAPGMCRVVVADCQTAGRGRRERSWLSPPGSGLYLSFAHTFRRYPRGLPALTLTAGIAVIDALQELGIGGVTLKWPNDLVLDNAKLGGILTEVQHEGGGRLTVVIGVGINIRLPESLQPGMDSEWAQRATDISSAHTPPERESLAAAIIDELVRAVAEFERHGFTRFVDRWPSVDWLLGKDIRVDDERHTISGMAAGVDTDGALIVETDAARHRVISGSITVSRPAGDVG